MILGVLMGMQQQSSADATTTSTSSSSQTASSTDPVSNLFSAMDTDSDGSVSQSELESYIENAGGTASEADTLYSQLNTSGSSSGISESDLASQAAPPPPPDGGGQQVHHHHHSGSASTSTDSQNSTIGDQMVSELDTDGDGSISSDELSSFLTANGGTSTEATSLFSSLSSDGSSGISASDINDAIANLSSSFATNPYASMLNMLDSFSSSSATASKTAGTTVSVSA
jgi:Ca2+-binding EF-hand superfamily protein